MHLTYGELDLLSSHVAGWLQSDSGLTAGDRVAIQMPNLIQYLVAVSGCAARRFGGCEYQPAVHGA